MKRLYQRSIFRGVFVVLFFLVSVWFLPKAYALSCLDADYVPGSVGSPGYPPYACLQGCVCANSDLYYCDTTVIDVGECVDNPDAPPPDTEPTCGEPCGGLGQGCCNNVSCDGTLSCNHIDYPGVLCGKCTGYRCQGEYSTFSCGGEGEECCPSNCHCDSGFTCDKPNNQCLPGWVPGELPALDVKGFLDLVRRVMIPVAILIGAILIIVNGYKFMTSQGDPRKVQDSREGLTSAIIGIVFVLLATVLLNFILQSFLGKA